jgi:hypothetical protein
LSLNFRLCITVYRFDHTSVKVIHCIPFLKRFVTDLTGVKKADKQRNDSSIDSEEETEEANNRKSNSKEQF